LNKNNFEESYNSSKSDEKTKKTKPLEKPEQKPVPQILHKNESSHKFTPQSQNEPESENQNVQKLKKKKVVKEDDLYPKIVENKYHCVNKMSSIGVLNKENELCDEIIEYKKKNGKEYNIWEDKKKSIKAQIDLMVKSVEEGNLDLKEYRERIKEQYKWEKKLLLFVEKDSYLNLNKKNIIKERVNDRMKIIEEELVANPDEEVEKEEENEEKKEKKESELNEIKEELKKQKPILLKEEDKEEIKKLTEVVIKRLNEYSSAVEYFKTNDFQDLKKEAINKVNKINYELSKIKIGKWDEVNEFELPGPITPEFIYGYDKNERNRRFDKLIYELGKERELVQEEINNKIKSIKNGNIKEELPEDKKECDALNEKKAIYEKTISLLKEKFQDKWVPAPLFVEREEESSVEKINVDVPDNTLRIIFGKTNYIKKKKLYLIVKLPDYNLEKKFEQIAPGDWSNQIDFNISENYYQLYNYKIEIDIYEIKMFKDHHSGKIIINLDPLKSHNEFVEKECKIKLDSKREGINCYIGVKIREALQEKEYITLKKINYSISRIYPPFKVRESNSIESINMNIQTPKVITGDLKEINSEGQDKSKEPIKIPENNPIKASVINQDEEKHYAKHFNKK